MSTRALIRIFVAVFVTASTLPLFAWDYRTCVGSKITWGSDTWVDFKIANTSFPVGPVRDSLNAAIGSWNFAPGHPFTFVPTFANLTAATMPNFSNEIIFTNTGFSSTELAVTKTWNSCTNLQEADVMFNSTKPWSFEANPTTLPSGSPYSLPLVAVHELGHALGLQHQNSTLAMMAPYYPNGGVVGQGTQQHFQPLADDIQGARSGYPGWCCPVIYDLYSSAYGSFNTTTTGLIVPASQVYRGGTGHFGFSVGNRGTSFTTVPVTFYLSTDRNITTSDWYMGSTTVSLAPGAHPAAYVNFPIPATFPTGTYYFGYIVDPWGSVAEADEANNAVAMAYPTQVPNYTPPTACFSIDPPWGMAGDEFFFDATCSSDVDGYVASYTWNFGDGSGDSGANVSHVYETAGIFDVTLTVTDNQGYSQQMASTIQVSGTTGCGLGNCTCIICE